MARQKPPSDRTLVQAGHELLSIYRQKQQSKAMRVVRIDDQGHVNSYSPQTADAPQRQDSGGGGGGGGEAKQRAVEAAGRAQPLLAEQPTPPQPTPQLLKQDSNSSNSSQFKVLSQSTYTQFT